MSANGACPHAQGESKKCIVLHVPVESGSGQLETDGRGQAVLECPSGVNFQYQSVIPPCFPLKVVPPVEGCHFKMILS